MCNYWTTSPNYHMSKVGLKGVSEQEHRAHQAEQTRAELSLKTRPSQKTGCRSERVCGEVGGKWCLERGKGTEVERPSQKLLENSLNEWRR